MVLALLAQVTMLACVQADSTALLQSTQRLAALGIQAAEDMESLSSELFQEHLGDLAQKRLDEEGGIDEATALALDNVLTQLNGTQFNTNKSQEAAQGSVNTRVQAMWTCDTDFTDGISAVDDEHGTNLNNAKSTHETCRNELSDIRSDQIATCKLLTDALASFTPFTEPNPAKGDVQGYFADLENWVGLTRQPLEKKETDCADLEAEDAQKITSCNTAQSDFEMKACTKRTESRENCDLYGTCYFGAQAAATGTIRAAEISTNQRKLDYRAAAKSICWLKLLRSESVTVDGINQCAALDPDTAHLNLVVPQIPVLRDCDSNLVADYPCAGNFEANYADMLNIAACAACEQHSIIHKPIQYVGSSIFKVVNPLDEKRTFSSIAGIPVSTTPLSFPSDAAQADNTRSMLWSEAGGTAWNPPSSQAPWSLTMDLDEIMTVRGVIVQKRASSDQYAKAITVEYGEDTAAQTIVEAETLDYNMPCTATETYGTSAMYQFGKSSCTAIVQFPVTVSARYIKISFSEYEAQPAMRAAVLI